MTGFRWLADQFFQLPRWERLGNILMIGFVLLAVLILSTWPVNEMTAAEKNELNRLQLVVEQKLEKAQAQKIKQHEKRFAALSTGVDSFRLRDINKASYEDLLRCGLSKYVSHNIVRYTEKGGRIETIEDARKIYGMTPEMLANLLEHTQLDSFKINRKTQPVKEVLVVDLNTADSVQLTGVKGIGGKTAQRIMAYRKQIGLFHHIDQLNEIRGIYPETLESIKKQVVVNAFEPFIHINTVSEEELFRHAYFRKDRLSKILVAYRQQHGRFNGPDDLKKCKLVTEEVFAKIIPYIVFD